jgi:CHRD domain
MKFLFQSILLAAAIVALAPVSHAQAAILNFTATLNGPSESPPVSSAGTGTTLVTLDTIANTLRIQGTFTGLTGTTTVAHIHSATPTAGSGTAGVATVPTLPFFPTGVTSGTYDTVLNLTLATSYNGTFITNNGGTPATAQAALTSSLLAGTAYFNIHSSFATGGEIRGFLTAVPEPSDMLGILSGLGAGLILKHKLKSSKSITKAVSKIN